MVVVKWRDVIFVLCGDEEDMVGENTKWEPSLEVSSVVSLSLQCPLFFFFNSLVYTFREMLFLRTNVNGFANPTGSFP